MKNKKYSWDNVTISMYRRILALPKDEDYAFNVVAVFENTELQDIMNAPITETLKCTAALSEFISKKPKAKAVKTHYNLNSRKYNVSLNPADINTAQYFDFINTEKKIPENLAQILAIFMIPDGKEYNTGYDIESAVYDIDNFMGIEEALGVCDFFTMLFQAYSRRVIRKAKKALKQAAKAGVPMDKIQEAQDKLKTYCQAIRYLR